MAKYTYSFVCLFVFPISLLAESSDLTPVRNHNVGMFNFETQSKCQEGLLHLIDTFMYHGRAWTIKGIDLARWPTKLQFEMDDGRTGNFRQVCEVDLVNCPPDSSECFCRMSTVQNNVYDLYLQRQATVVDSGRRIRLTWRNLAGNESRIAATATVPRIYDPERPDGVLRINWLNVSTSRRSCSISLLAGRNTLSYCCQNRPRPCDVSLEEPQAGIQQVGEQCATVELASAEKLTFLFYQSSCLRPPRRTLECPTQIVPYNCILNVSVGFLGTRPGLPGIVQCSFYNSCPARRFGWTLRSLPLVNLSYNAVDNELVMGALEAQHRVEYSEPGSERGHVNLTYSKLKCGQDREYVCGAEYGDPWHQVPASATGYQNVGVPPEVPTMTRSLSEAEVVEGAELTLSCLGQVGAGPEGRIDWRWYRKQIYVGDDVMATARINVSEKEHQDGGRSCGLEVTTTFTFRVSREDEGATVACFVSNERYDIYVAFHCTYSERQFCSLAMLTSVQYGVTDNDVTVTTDPRVINEGQRVVLTCEAKGNPVPAVTWVRKGKPGGGWPTEGRNRLVIDEVAETHVGLYVCEVVNVVNNRTFRVTKHVEVDLSSRTKSKDDKTHTSPTNRMTVLDIVLLVLVVLVLVGLLISTHPLRCYVQKEGRDDQPAEKHLSVEEQTALAKAEPSWDDYHVGPSGSLVDPSTTV